MKTHAHVKSNRLLQACVTAEVAMHWPSMVEKCAAPRAWPCGLLPHDAADPAALHFSPLHWLALASSRAIPTPLSTSQLNQLFQDALFCVPEGSKLPAMPRLPRGALGADATPCDLAAYILRQCVPAACATWCWGSRGKGTCLLSSRVCVRPALRRAACWWPAACNLR